jgi:hypothetical protein
MSVSIKHRYGNHGGRPTEWEISVSRSEDPYCADIVADLPKDFKNISHSGMDRKYVPASEWLNLPEGTSARDAGAVASFLASGNVRALIVALRIVDRQDDLPARQE